MDREKLCKEYAAKLLDAYIDAEGEIEELAALESVVRDLAIRVEKETLLHVAEEFTYSVKSRLRRLAAEVK